MCLFSLKILYKLDNNRCKEEEEKFLKYIILIHNVVGVTSSVFHPIYL